MPHVAPGWLSIYDPRLRARYEIPLSSHFAGALERVHRRSTKYTPPIASGLLTYCPQRRLKAQQQGDSAKLDKMQMMHQRKKHEESQ